MELFAVFREGVQRHECGGIFTTYPKAKAAAIALCRGEPDDWHRYGVVAFNLDEVTPQYPATEAFTYGGLLEPPALCEVTREGEELTVIETAPTG